MSLRLDARLSSAAALVRGGRLADVGTDHAFLPVALLLMGKIDFAVASDINKGPLARARKTVAEHGLADKVELLLSDGLQGIEKYAPDDIAILGMGGELIASIIENAPWVKDGKYRLILQPMTRRDTLRQYLITHGFFIKDELMSRAEGRIYQTICAEYVGYNTEYDLSELLLGRHNIERGGELFDAYVARLKDTYNTRLEGKRRSGADAREEEAVLAALEKFCIS